MAGYHYETHGLSPSHEYLLPGLFNILQSLRIVRDQRRVFDLGCGNGSVADWLYQRGFDVTGIDSSQEGIEQARRAYPNLKICEGSVYDDLAVRFGRFPVVISLEVVEHCFFPRRFVRTLFDLTQPGGTAIVSTPYHGYWKNLSLALSGQMDRHFTALWDYGHIKFWSMKTLRHLLEEAGF